MHNSLLYFIGVIALLALLACNTTPKAPYTEELITAELMEDEKHPLELVFSGLDEVEGKTSFYLFV